MIAAADSFKNPTHRVHELCQTDFTYFKIVGWGWYDPGSVLDDFSRYIIAWKLFTTMSATDVNKLSDVAVEKTGVQEVAVRHRPRRSPTTDRPTSPASSKPTCRNEEWVTRGAPYHPLTQGKIERFHRSMKNEVKLQHYYMPGELEIEIGRFIEYYNNQRYHESLKNVTPADVYFGRNGRIETRREKLKKQTLQLRKMQNLTNHNYQLST